MSAGAPQSGGRLPALLPLVLLASACAGEGATAGDQPQAAGSRAGQMPAIYVDSDVELLSNDRNQVAEGYARNLQVCEGTGLAVVPLSAGDEAKLGKGRLQRWYRGDAFAYRWEEWRYAAGETRETMCSFALVTTGVHEYFSPGSHQAVNLSTGATHANPPRDADFFARTPEQARSNTVPAGRVPERDREVAGQSCEHARAGHIEGCAWSGGARWGFNARVPSLQPNNVPHLNRTIVLEQDPVRGSGMRVRTATFQIHADFDPASMQPGDAP